MSVKIRSFTKLKLFGKNIDMGTIKRYNTYIILTERGERHKGSVVVKVNRSIVRYFHNVWYVICILFIQWPSNMFLANDMFSE